MNIYSFYLPDGSVLPQKFCGTEAQLAEQMPLLPAGACALLGSVDHTRYKVALDPDGPPVPVPCLPPAPDGDALVAYAWDLQAWCWVPYPTLAAAKLEAEAALLATMAALEGTQARPLRDLLLALATGQAAPQTALQALQALEAGMGPLRARLAAVRAATTFAELEAANAPS